jgi:N utilization substance protein B
MSDVSQLHTNNPIDPRHQRRVEHVQTLFAASFDGEVSLVEPYIIDFPELTALAADITIIDALIAKAAPERPLKDINKIDLAILRLCVFESRSSKTPKKVIIDEAVELAKEFGTDSSPRFVNGVLAQILTPKESATT